jgi:hypothetical protein
LATPPEKRAPTLDPAVIARRLEKQPWDCTKVKDFARHSTWRTQFGFHFSIPHDCTEADFEAVMADIRKYGRKRDI